MLKACSPRYNLDCIWRPVISLLLVVMVFVSDMQYTKEIIRDTFVNLFMIVTYSITDRELPFIR